jgi:alkylhydroperoxidase/carboxymuconolactone decarboxylase family protein YurZ
MIISFDTEKESDETLRRAALLLDGILRERAALKTEPDRQQGQEPAGERTDAYPYLRREMGGTDPIAWRQLAALDPRFFTAAERLFGYPAVRHALGAKERALVEFAMDALVTQLDQGRLQESARRAKMVGATRDELLCIAEVTAVIGLHSCSVAMPILFEELPAETSRRPLTPEQSAVARRFETSGPRPRPVDGMFGAILRLDAEYFQRFSDYIDVPWREDILDRRIKELIYIAIDVACTHLYADGIHRHVRAALGIGITPEEILEVIQIASATGLRTIQAAFPIIRTVFADS